MHRQEMIRRLKEGEDPLEVSILGWKDTRETLENKDSSTCALCYITNDNCDDCVIAEHTGFIACLDTPYGDYDEDPTRLNASRMITFLKSLREH
jgi:hypothetical protein